MADRPPGREARAAPWACRPLNRIPRVVVQYEAVYAYAHGRRNCPIGRIDEGSGSADGGSAERASLDEGGVELRANDGSVGVRDAASDQLRRRGGHSGEV